MVAYEQAERKTVTQQKQLSVLPQDVMQSVGIEPSPDKRSGTYILSEFDSPWVNVNTEGMELLPISVALEQYGYLADKYLWRAVQAKESDLSAHFASTLQGYFIRVRRGAKVSLPVQACMHIGQHDFTQSVHNIIILEEDSELCMITGCVTSQNVMKATHFGVSEYYIGRNASLTSTMIHNWGPEVTIFPRAGTIIEANGKFISNYITLKPGKQIKANPITRLEGDGSSAKYLTIVLGSHGSLVDLGGDVYLNGENSKAELLHRAVCTGGQVYQRGMLYGNALNCRAHVDCAGMLISTGENGFIEAVPGVKSYHPQARLSHEASIGSIDPEAVTYLQSRGMEEQEAISLIIRGFLDPGIEGLGAELNEAIDKIAKLAGHGEK